MSRLYSTRKRNVQWQHFSKLCVCNAKLSNIQKGCRFRIHSLFIIHCIEIHTHLWFSIYFPDQKFILIPVPSVEDRDTLIKAIINIFLLIIIIMHQMTMWKNRTMLVSQINLTQISHQNYQLLAHKLCFTFFNFCILI